MDGRLRSMTSVYFVREDGVLCLFRIGSRIANNKYIGAAGGHFEKDEVASARNCVLREMEEELGLTEEDTEGLDMKYITLRLKDGEVRQNYYFFARLKMERELKSSEGTLKWVKWDELAGLEMPVSAKHMILHYAKIGRFNDQAYASVALSENEGDAVFAPLNEF